MYLVIHGGGKIGAYLADRFLKKGHEVAIIEKDEHQAEHLSAVLRGRYLVIHGDGCDSRYQEEAGIRRAKVFVATTGQDDDNLVSCEIAMRVFDVERCIARVNSPKNQNIFRKVGIESVSSTELISSLIEEEALMGSMGVVTSLNKGNVSMVEMTVPRMRNHSVDHGIAIGDISLPENSLIVAVDMGNDVQVANPDVLLYSGDKIIVVADAAVMDEVRTVINNL